MPYFICFTSFNITLYHCLIYFDTRFKLYHKKVSLCSIIQLSFRDVYCLIHIFQSLIFHVQRPRYNKYATNLYPTFQNNGLQVVNVNGENLHVGRHSIGSGHSLSSAGVIGISGSVIEYRFFIY